MVLRSPMHVDFIAREDGHESGEFRVAFFGVGLAGKTSNLLSLARSTGLPTVDVTWSTPPDAEPPETIWYDRVAVRLVHDGESRLIQAYSLPGQVRNPLAWRLLLQVAHGIVFVIDSQRERIDANLAMAALLDEITSGLEQPRQIVVQYNKRDLPNAAAIRTLRKVINPKRLPEFDAVATEARGVLETMRSLLTSSRL